MYERADRDVPAPPTLREVAATLPGPVYSFAPQSHLEAFAASSTRASGRVVAVSMSYTFYRYPAQPGDARNFVGLTPQQRAAIARADSSSLPEWIRDQIRRLRYPTLFEAVRTSLPIPAERAHPLEARLEAHVTEFLRALFPGQPLAERLRTVRGAPLSEYDVRRGVPVRVDGESRRGYRVDIAPHVIAVGAYLEDRYLTAIIPSDFHASITPAFATL
jgi:hypothetical protein